MPVAGHEEGGPSFERSGKEVIVVVIIGDGPDLPARRHNVRDQIQRQDPSIDLVRGPQSHLT